MYVFTTSQVRLEEFGAEKEEYVISSVLVAAKEINYDVDEVELKAFIENTIALTKHVNIK